MTISKKQFDFTIRGRVLAIDSTSTLTLANLQCVTDAVVLEGVEYDLTTPLTAGAGAEQFSYPSVVIDTATPSNTATLATTTSAVKAIIGALKGIS